MLSKKEIFEVSIKEILKEVAGISSIVDSHVHIFPPPLNRAIYKWFGQAGWKLSYPEDTSLLQKTLEETAIEKAFLLYYAHKADMSLELNAWARDFTANNPQFLPFGSIHPEDKDIEKVLALTLDEWSFPGIKLHLGVAPFMASDKKLFPIYKGIEERGKRLVVHVGTCPYPEGLREHLGIKPMAKVLEKFPKLKLIIPHLGLDDFREALALVKEYPNVYLDTAFILGNPRFNPKDYIEDLLSIPDKVLYGSDTPFVEHDITQGLMQILNLGLDKNFYQKLLRDNAYQFLGSARNHEAEN